MEEKQKKNRYDEVFLHGITERAKEMGLLKKNEITSGEILGIIADMVGESYQPKSGNYILNRWGDYVKKILSRERKTVYSSEKGRRISTIVFVPIKEEAPIPPLRTNEEKRELIGNIVNVIDKQSAARNNKIYVPNLREIWVGDKETQGIALLCKAAKVLRSTFGFGFTYDYDKLNKVVRIQDGNKLREQLLKLLPPAPKEKKEEKQNNVVLSQFVKLTDAAADTIYLIGAALNKSQRGIEVYSLAKFLSEAPSLVMKNLSASDIKLLVKTVGSEYFTLQNGSDIIGLTVGGWEKIQKKFDPRDRYIEILVLIKEEMKNVTILNKEIGLGSLITDCSWESFKSLAREVYSGKVKLPADKKLEEKLMKDVENDLIKLQKMENPFV